MRIRTFLRWSALISIFVYIIIYETQSDIYEVFGVSNSTNLTRGVLVTQVSYKKTEKMPPEIQINRNFTNGW